MKNGERKTISAKLRIIHASALKIYSSNDPLNIPMPYMIMALSIKAKEIKKFSYVELLITKG